MPLISFGGAKHDVWLSAIIAIIFGMVGSYIITSLAAKYPSMTIIQSSQHIMGKWLGKLIGLIYIIVSIILAATFTRDFIELFLHFITPFMSDTILVTVTLATSVFVIRTGLQGIGRLAELLVPLLFGAIITGLILSIGNISYIPTIRLEQSWSSLLTDALTQLPYLGMIMAWLFLYPYLPQKSQTPKTLYLSLFIVGLALILVASTIIAVHGPFVPPRLNYHFFTIIQLIEIAGFLRGVEIIFLVGWISTSIIAITLFYYLSVLSVQQWLGIKRHERLIIPLGIICGAGAIYGFDSYMSLRVFFDLEHLGIIVLPVEFGLPLFLLLVNYFKERFSPADSLHAHTAAKDNHN